MPARWLPMMVHQPIRFHIVLHKALRVARRGRETRGDTEREETGQRCLIRCCWSIDIERQSLQKLDSSRFNCLFYYYYCCVSAFSSDATACLPESLRYFHSNVNSGAFITQVDFTKKVALRVPALRLLEYSRFGLTFTGFSMRLNWLLWPLVSHGTLEQIGKQTRGKTQKSHNRQFKMKMNMKACQKYFQQYCF